MKKKLSITGSLLLTCCLLLGTTAAFARQTGDPGGDENDFSNFT